MPCWKFCIILCNPFHQLSVQKKERFTKNALKNEGLKIYNGPWLNRSLSFSYFTCYCHTPSYFYLSQSNTMWKAVAKLNSYLIHKLMTDLLRFLFHFCKTLIKSSWMDPHNKLFTNCPTHPFSWTYVRLSKTFQCKGNTIINVSLSLSVNSSFLCIGLVFRNSQHFGTMYSL